tara:strand:- start:1056 stop:1571 length:516 start_codon:yes stop_codon:yes gene_type:complete
MMRFAGKTLSKLGPATKNLLFGDMNAKQIAQRLGFDAVFGGMAALQTPGDLGDKLIAGTSTFAGGGLTGLAAGGLARRTPGLRQFEGMADLIGSFGGDYLGMMAGDSLQRGKDKLMGGEGLTPWERMSAVQQAEFAQQLEQQIMAQYGIIPGTREQYAMPYTNPSTGMGVA